MAETTIKTVIQQLRKHLKDDLLDFWLRHGIDHQYGGYLTCLDYYGRVYCYDKYSIVQTRMVYAFSEGFRLFQDERYRDAARQGFEFYIKHFWDKQYQGWFHGLSRTGAYLWEPHKRAYDFAFVIYCFSQYYGAIGDHRALDAIEKTLNLLDQKLADHQADGWFESFERDWNHRKETGKSFNVCMHLLEAMLSGFENIDQAQYLPRLEHLLDLIHQHCLVPQQNLPAEYFDEAWLPKRVDNEPIINYGHVMETALFFLRIAELLNRPDLKQKALQYIEFSMENGFNPRTGMACFGHPSGTHDELYYYWNQSETLAALSRAYRITGNVRMWNWFLAELTVIFGKFADFENGEWILRVDPDGQPGDLLKGAVHKAAYHVTQAVASTIRALEQRR